MDYKKLAKVADSATTKDEINKKIQDAIERRKEARSKARKEARSKARKEARIKDGKTFKTFKVTDSYKNLLKKIKDELLNTETTEDAVEVVLAALEDQPAEQVLAAAVEVLAEAIDALQVEQEKIEENPEEKIEENPEEN